MNLESAPPFACDEVDGVQRLVLSGSLGAAQAVALRGYVAEKVQRTRRLSVDCAGLEGLDSCVLQLLVALSRALAEHGQSLELCHAHPDLLAFVELAGLQRDLPARAAGTTS